MCKQDNFSRRSFVKQAAVVPVAVSVFLSSEAFSDNEAAAGGATAKIVSPQKMVAGSHERIIIEITNGSRAIEVGGALLLSLHHAVGMEWKLQVHDVKGSGYIAVDDSDADNFKLDYDSYLVTRDKMFDVSPPSFSSNSIFHNAVAARVLKSPIKPGQKVRVIIGANERKAKIPASCISAHEFRVSLDSDADGKFENIEKSPMMDIKCGEVEHFAAFIPSCVMAGSEFRMSVRAEDKHYNQAENYNGSADIYDENERLLRKGVKFTAGIAQIDLSIGYCGPQRIRIVSGDIRGRSNPCRVVDKLPENHIYWGDIHGHTDISDGLAKTSDIYFNFGKNSAFLDVCALTDHGHFDWPQTIDSVKKFYEPGKFVTLLAQEGGTTDHYNYYYKDPDMPHIKGWPSTNKDMLDELKKQFGKGNVITGPHHFTFNRGNDKYPFDEWDDDIVRFVELYSSHGCSEYLGNPRPCPGAAQDWKFMQTGVAKGRKFGVIGSSDSHTSQVGRSISAHYPNGLTAFIAPKLDRESIWEAFFNYRVYATSFDRIYVDFSIDGQQMGSTINKSSACRIKYYVLGKTDNMEVFLIHNNKEIRKDVTGSGLVEISVEIKPEDGSNFYYLRVVQDNGERAWSTPIWINA